MSVPVLGVGGPPGGQQTGAGAGGDEPGPSTRVRRGRRRRSLTRSHPGGRARTPAVLADPSHGPLRRCRVPPGRDRWISRTRFQPVVAYRDLARNARDTLTKGMAVTVTGRLLDDSFTPDGADYPVRRDKLEALDVAVSLRFATAVVEKVGKSAREEGLEHNREQMAAGA